jgi:signal transduction histidine kinase
VLNHTEPRLLQEQNIALDIPERLIALANAQYLRQILRNLLSNAFKYTPVGTLITISASLSTDAMQPESPLPVPGASACIRVKDAGPGIPPDELPLLFGQFVRLKRDISGPVRGTGLGLHISKQLVEAMNGRIWVESTGIPGQGSTFSFTLPAVLHTTDAPHSEEMAGTL